MSGGDTVRLVPSCRLTLGLLTSVALFLLYMLRSNISLTLVCMVKRSPVNISANNNNNNTTTVDYDVNVTSSDDVSMQGEFEWSRQLQGIILSAYFYGYLMTQVIGGWLAGRYGGKHVLGVGMLVSVVATMLTPAAARLHGGFLVVLRALLGASSGVIFPTIQSLWGVWAPPLERSLLSSLSYFGMSFGTMTALLASSLFCLMPLDNGWPFAFYFTGGLAFVFWICWNLLGFSSPDKHPRISEQERIYITSATGIKDVGHKQKAKFPWLKAVLSPAVLAILAAQTASTWFTYTATMTLPLYMKDVLLFSVKENGFYLMLPNLAILVVCIPLGQLADWLRKRKILSTKVVRKVYQGISSFGCAVLLVILGYVDYERRYFAVALIVAMYATQAFCRCGFLVNPQDIAPRFSGEIFGVANTIASLSGIIAPSVVGALTPTGTRQEWQSVFYISAAIFVVGGLLFVIFAQGEVLDWAKTPQDTVTASTTVELTKSCKTPETQLGEEKV